MRNALTMAGSDLGQVFEFSILERTDARTSESSYFCFCRLGREVAQEETAEKPAHNRASDIPCEGKDMLVINPTDSNTVSMRWARRALERAGHDLLIASRSDRAAIWRPAQGGTSEVLWSKGFSADALSSETSHLDRDHLRRLSLEGIPITVDVAAAQHKGNGSDKPRAYRSKALWPLTFEGILIGVAGCYFRRPRRWGDADLKRMAAFIQQTSSSLHHAQRLDADISEHARTAGLFRLTGALNQIDDPEAMAVILLDSALELLAAESGAVLLLDRHQIYLRVSAARGAPEQWLGQLLPRQEGLPWRCLIAGRVYLTQPAEAGRQSGVEEMPLGQGVAVWAPVCAGPHALGVLALALGQGVQPTEDVRAFVEHAAQIAGNALRRGLLMQGLQQAQLETVLALANAVNARDEYTGEHSKRLAPLAEATAKRLGCSEDELEDIRWGAMLHDIGKIAVPDPILLKPGPLTEDEWEIVRRHPERGEAIVRTVDALRRTATLIRHHQERFDGKGYPDALDGDHIPLGARILAVVDAYSAIRDRRPYKDSRSHGEAVAELRRCKGTQFDPNVVETFLSVVEAVPAGA